MNPKRPLEVTGWLSGSGHTIAINEKERAMNPKPDDIAAVKKGLCELIPRWIGPMLPTVAQNLTALLDSHDKLEKELRECAAFMYQYAGATGAPIEVLDNLSDLANGEPKRHADWPYPAGSEKFDRLEAENARLQETNENNVANYDLQVRELRERLEAAEEILTDACYGDYGETSGFRTAAEKHFAKYANPQQSTDTSPVTAEKGGESQGKSDLWFKVKLGIDFETEKGSNA